MKCLFFAINSYMCNINVIGGIESEKRSARIFF